MGCGAGLAQAPAAPTGMRFVTVAFCDISGSTQMALRFDPQVWHAILEAYFAEVGGALVDAGGRLEKFIGDAVVGVFGADAAGEDDAQRAVRGALAALQRLNARNDEAISRYGVRLSIRFGIASGLVVMADRDSSFAIGSVMNRAARLQAAAPPDGTVIDVRTWLLVRDRAHCEPVPPVPAKGFDKPLQAWSVTDAATEAAAAPVFVNQTELVTRLTTAVTGAAPGVTVIGLTGELGSGKSRILQRVCAGAKDRRMQTVHIECGGNDEGLWRLQQIERDLGGKHSTAHGAPSTTELQWRIRRRLAELAAQRPLLVTIDDYDRSPQALRELVDVPVNASGPIVFLLAGRELPTASPELLRVPPLSDAHAQELPAGRELPTASPELLRVPPLSDAHAQELLDALSGDIELHSAVASPLIQRSHGNPLFLEQLAALAAEGIDDEVAPSAEAALGARIERLAAPARHILACLGAWDTELRPGDLDAVCALDETAFTAGLTALQQAGLADNRTAAEVAYAHLVLGERARVHTAIAQRLQAYAQADPARLDVAVTHATRAHRYWRELDPGSAKEHAAARLATHCLLAAARRAIARSEVRSAVALTGAARELGVPENDLILEVAALESYALGACGQVAESLERIAAVAGTPGNPSARVHLEVNEMAFGTGDAARTRAAADAVGDPCASARVDTWEGVRAARAGDYPRAEKLLRSAYLAMRDFGAGLGVAEIYGNLSLFLAQADTAVPLAAAECLALRDEVADAPILHAAVSCAAALLLQQCGQRDRAVQMLSDALTVFTEMGHVMGEAGAHEFASAAAEIAGDLPAAREAIVAAQRVYLAAGATGPAGRCGLRAYILAPSGAAPDPDEWPRPDTWEARVLRHQAGALAAPSRAKAMNSLTRAISEISAIRGGGATLIPLIGCHRIAQTLDPQVAQALQEKIDTLRHT